MATRTRFFNGQFLTKDDFEDEQKYHITMRQRHNRDLHTPGIVNGLELTSNGAEIIITRGWAIDAQGREIELEEDEPRDLTDFKDKGAHLVKIEFDEEQLFPQGNGEDNQTRTRELSNIKLIPFEPGDNARHQPILGVVEVSAAGEVTLKEPSLRLKAGIKAGDLRADSLTTPQIIVRRPNSDGALAPDKSVVTPESLETGTVTASEHVKAKEFLGIGVAKAICYVETSDNGGHPDARIRRGYGVEKVEIAGRGKFLIRLTSECISELVRADPPIEKADPVILCNSLHGWPTYVDGVDLAKNKTVSIWICRTPINPGEEVNFNPETDGILDSFYLAVF